MDSYYLFLRSPDLFRCGWCNVKSRFSLEDLRPETEGTSTTDLVDGFFSWILMNPHES